MIVVLLSKTAHETYNGSGMVADTKDEYDLQTLTYQKIADCSRVMEEYGPECKPSQETGSFTLKGDGLVLGLPELTGWQAPDRALFMELPQ